MTLFDVALQNHSLMPLAARMRPTRLDDIVGQSHVLGERGAIRGWVQKGQLPSLILWGPPGVGKTTLAQTLCNELKGTFINLSAVLAGVKDIREAVDKAKDVRVKENKKTYVFIDEIHRFNRAQQDALLPHVESGLITLIGATTENPSFSVNSPLLSRCRLIVLKPLSDEELNTLIKRALVEQEKGMGAKQLQLTETANEALITSCNGDGRLLLSTLEAASDLVGEGKEITKEHIEQAIGRRILTYDKSKEAHYDVISAFIKSLRGSDPDAACHYLARMLESGEDPRFVVRRMVVFASEDIGNADPAALQIAVAAMHAFELMGMPEGYLPLTQAATYLACAQKSNAVITAYQEAKADVIKQGALPVPLHLRNAPTAMMKKLGYKKAYQYPHDFPDNYVSDTYLPEKLEGKVYYKPTQNGYEKIISERMAKRKERHMSAKR